MGRLLNTPLTIEAFEHYQGLVSTAMTNEKRHTGHDRVMLFSIRKMSLVIPISLSPLYSGNSFYEKTECHSQFGMLSLSSFAGDVAPMHHDDYFEKFDTSVRDTELNDMEKIRKKEITEISVYVEEVSFSLSDKNPA